MADVVCVNVTGPALALLLYENVKCTDTQEGFLLGEITEVVTRTITDADSHNVNLKRVINVTAVLPCPRACLFYNAVGQIDRTVLKELLGDQDKCVVAWFKYGRNSKFRLSMREKIIHKELSAHFSVPDRLFSCCVLSSGTSGALSTRTFSHTFVRHHNGAFHTLPLHIDNLGENCDSYKPNVHTTRSFLKLYNGSVTADGAGERPLNDWDIIGNVQDALQKEINRSVVQLSRSEQKLGLLESEVDALRQTLEAKRSEQQRRLHLQQHQAPQQENELGDSSSEPTEYILVKKKTGRPGSSADAGTEMLICRLCDTHTQTEGKPSKAIKPAKVIPRKTEMVIDLTSDEETPRGITSKRPSQTSNTVAPAPPVVVTNQVMSYAQMAGQKTKDT